MALNRRNILVGLGALVGGGGALVGTGAFTSVSAARSVSVETAGDGSAFLGISENSEYIVDDSDGTMRFELAGSDSTTATSNNSSTGFNNNAITTLANVATLTNNSQDGDQVSIGLASDSNASANADANSDEATVELPDADVTFHVGQIDDSDDSAVPVSSGSSTSLHVVVDTTVSRGGSNSGNLTIIAEDESENPGTGTSS
ncbi:hypothetical protein [Halobellus sp. EA9]|uniref:hypothetical protein n=1 Tax=Halobellus sp. EA9 TaxID=3421647 RepID=UPI003EBD35FC